MPIFASQYEKLCRENEAAHATWQQCIERIKQTNQYPQLTELSTHNLHRSFHEFQQLRQEYENVNTTNSRKNEIETEIQRSTTSARTVTNTLTPSSSWSGANSALSHNTLSNQDLGNHDDAYYVNKAKWQSRKSMLASAGKFLFYSAVAVGITLATALAVGAAASSFGATLPLTFGAIYGGLKAGGLIAGSYATNTALPWIASLTKPGWAPVVANTPAACAIIKSYACAAGTAIAAETAPAWVPTAKIGALVASKTAAVGATAISHTAAIGSTTAASLSTANTATSFSIPQTPVASSGLQIGASVLGSLGLYKVAKKLSEKDEPDPTPNSNLR